VRSNSDPGWRYLAPNQLGVRHGAHAGAATITTVFVIANATITRFSAPQQRQLARDTEHVMQEAPSSAADSEGESSHPPAGSTVRTDPAWLDGSQAGVAACTAAAVVRRWRTACCVQSWVG
jgi:hypothetical protein